ncbi:MAG: response regulator transcription factor [Oligoflexus sp.]|jgi:DNA-binding response OmpR family regulator|nr:response regulator transcription factor [Pseudopedobacter sp.]
MADKKMILIVEDESKVAAFISKGLNTQNLLNDIASCGSEAIQLFNKNNYDLVILDIGLPDMSGLNVCEHIRKSNQRIPILMLTAMSSLSDKLSGFEVGTNDYMVKPFDFMELLVRVRSLLQFHKAVTKRDETIQVSDLELDLNEKIARRAGKEIELTAREFSLLEYLMVNKGKVVSKIELAENVWDINFDTRTNFIEVYINYVRNKVDKGFSNKLIHTVVGMGYMIKQK